MVLFVCMAFWNRSASGGYYLGPNHIVAELAWSFAVVGTIPTFSAFRAG